LVPLSVDRDQVRGVPHLKRKAARGTVSVSPWAEPDWRLHSAQWQA
jgi:hypothetical protein